MTFSPDSRAVTAVLASCALIMTALVIRRELLVPAKIAPREGEAIALVQEDWRTFASEGRRLGPADALVTIVEFSDFQCRFCRQFAAYRDSLTSLGIKTQLVYRHFPDPSNPFSLAAAVASECAGSQGRFEEMHDRLFKLPDTLGQSPWWKLAVAAGVRDSVAFAACIASEEPRKAITRDSVAARALRIRGTPTLLIHDRRIDGLPSFDSVVAYVERARNPPR